MTLDYYYAGRFVSVELFESKFMCRPGSCWIQGLRTVLTALPLRWEPSERTVTGAQEDRPRAS